MTRASRLLGSEERTSHNPPLKERHTGRPTGQPNCTFAISRPIVRLSSLGKSLSQSRTGSRPVADRQTANGIECKVAILCIKKDALFQADGLHGLRVSFTPQRRALPP